MATKFDIGEFEHELSELSARPHLEHLAVVVPLAPGMRELASRAIAEGPPFDPVTVGLTSHQVLLTDREAVFVFGLAHGPGTLERILADDDFWSVVHWWEQIAGDRPQIAEVAYTWAAG
jgi:hypothetical protein